MTFASRRAVACWDSRVKKQVIPGPWGGRSCPFRGVENHFQTTVRTTISVETRYGVLGKLMETFALKPKMSATMSSALEQFKQYVEKSHLEAQRNAAPLQAHAVRAQNLRLTSRPSSGERMDGPSNRARLLRPKESDVRTPSDDSLEPTRNRIRTHGIHTRSRVEVRGRQRGERFIGTAILRERSACRPGASVCRGTVELPHADVSLASCARWFRHR